MEHVSSVRPTGKFSEKVENLERWSRFPGWNFRTECRVPFTFLVVCTSSRSTVGHRYVSGVYDQMEQLFTNRKFHFCYHRNFRGFFLNGKRPLGSLLRRGLFVLWGGFCVVGRLGRKKKRARGALFPSFPARFLLLSIIDILMGIPSGSLCGGESPLGTRNELEVSQV